MTDLTLEPRRDQLYRLLPALYRVLDEMPVAAEHKGQLRAVLAVLGEQVNLLEDDLQRWYDNWFIETCEDWVVPYIGDLIGYESAAKELNTTADPESPLNRAVVFPRREVADTIAMRRRKGTLALLEELSHAIVGWPARAVEFRTLVSGTAALNHMWRHRSSTVAVRDGTALALLGTPFERLPRTVDVRRIDSHHTTGRHNLPAIGLFVYRRKIDAATLVPTRTHADPERRTFDVQGFDVPLHVLPQAEESPDTIAERINLPVPLSRGVLRPDTRKNAVGASSTYYHVGKSLFVVVERGGQRTIVPADRIAVTDLSRWRFDPGQDDLVAVDPELGRLAFARDNPPDKVWTSYHYGRTAFMGGGEYDRRLEGEPTEPVVDLAANAFLTDSIETWKNKAQKPPHTIIEIADNEEHAAEFDVTVEEGQTFELRAANRYRPLLRAADRSGQIVERCHFRGKPGSRLILDGLLFGEGGMLLEGEFDSILIRHCTLTPGRTRLVIRANDTDVLIESSIVGEIATRVPPSASAKQAPDSPPLYNEPVRLRVLDSILDGTATACGPAGRSAQSSEAATGHALAGAARWAHVPLTAARTTVFGPVDVERVELVVNCIFCDRLSVENCLEGCVRFSYMPPDSQTPPPFHCQPAQALERVALQASAEAAAEVHTRESELARVVPRFVSTDYAHPDYARLADDCARELLRGADDEGEMGVYHDEFFDQRAAHLRRRLAEFVPAASDAEIIFET